MSKNKALVPRKKINSNKHLLGLIKSGKTIYRYGDLLPINLKRHESGVVVDDDGYLILGHHLRSLYYTEKNKTKTKIFSKLGN